MSSPSSTSTPLSLSSGYNNPISLDLIQNSSEAAIYGSEAAFDSAATQAADHINWPTTGSSIIPIHNTNHTGGTFDPTRLTGVDLECTVFRWM